MGYLTDRVIPAVTSNESDDALNQLGRLGYDIHNMTIKERAIAMAENGIKSSVDFFNAAGGGLAGLGVLASGGGLDAAVETIEGAQDESPFQYDIESRPGRVMEESLGMMGDPLDFGVKKAGQGIFKMTDSPIAATVGQVGLGAVIPTKFNRTKKVKSRSGEMVPRPNKMTDVPDIRDLDVTKALEIAKYEPHLIEGGEGSEGKYIGGPRSFESKRAVTEQRKKFDAIIERGQEGGDWYDRYRDNVTEVTGGSALDDLWMANMEGQYSAGVDPGGEVGFSIKDTNSGIAFGKPTKPARPAQQAATTRAIEQNDPTQFQLGAKTGEYAKRINPSLQHDREATGVNDFRHARNLGYTEKTGEPQKGGLGSSQHKYADFETALAVGRANEGRLAGREDWTGEQVQAAAWVAQKGDDIYERRKVAFDKKAQIMIDRDGLNEPVETIGRQLAFDEANKTIGDFYDKHTAFATHEQQPFVDAGHLPGLANASLAERAEFAGDPLSSWDIGGRDAIYGGARLGETGIAMRTRPTTEMQGAYLPPGGKMEFNPGKVARPLVGFNSGDTKTVPDADKSLLNAGEAIRGAIDVQGAGAWHKGWTGGKVGDSNSIEIKREGGALQPSNPDELMRLQKVAKEFGFDDVVDTGQGFTFTTFEGGPKKIEHKELKELVTAIADELPNPDVQRSKVDSGYLGYEDEWKGGGVTKKLLKTMDEMPTGTRAAMDNNPHIPQIALNKLERDEKYREKFGAVREDVQNLRRIIGEGPGWMDRLKKALQAGVVLPALAAVAMGLQSEEETVI